MCDGFRQSASLGLREVQKEKTGMLYATSRGGRSVPEKTAGAFHLALKAGEMQKVIGTA